MFKAHDTQGAELVLPRASVRASCDPVSDPVQVVEHMSILVNENIALTATSQALYHALGELLGWRNESHVQHVIRVRTCSRSLQTPAPARALLVVPRFEMPQDQALALHTLIVALDEPSLVPQLPQRRPPVFLACSPEQIVPCERGYMNSSAQYAVFVCKARSNQGGAQLQRAWRKLANHLRLAQCRELVSAARHRERGQI